MTIISAIAENLATRYGNVDWDTVDKINHIFDDLSTGELKPDEVDLDFLTSLDNNAPDEDLQNEFLEVAANMDPLGPSSLQVVDFKIALYKLPVVNKGIGTETYQDVAELLRNVQCAR